MRSASLRLKVCKDLHNTQKVLSLSGYVYFVKYLIEKLMAKPDTIEMTKSLRYSWSGEPKNKRKKKSIKRVAMVVSFKRVRERR